MRGCFISVLICSLVIVLMTTALYFAVAGRSPVLNEGRVLDMRYTPPHTSQLPVTAMRPGGGISITYRRSNHPASYEILVLGTKEDGSELTEWWSVGEELYSSLKIGDYIRRN